MLKKLSRIWLSGLKQAGKAGQRQQRALIKELLQPLTPTAARKKASTPKRPKKAAAPPGRVQAARRTARPRPSPAGHWRAYCHTLAGSDPRQPPRRMNYWVYLPAGRPSQGLPLLVMLHGCDQTALAFAQGTRMNQLADQKGFAVVYPQQSLRGHPQRCWPWYERTVQQGGGEIESIIGIVARTLRQHALDPCRVYAAGLSAGAGMAHILAIRYPHLIAAVGLHSGPVFGFGHHPMAAYGVMQHGALKDSGSAIQAAYGGTGIFPTMPAILFQGSADKVVRPVNQAQLMQQFRLQNQLGPEHASLIQYKPAGRSKRNAAHAYRLQDYYLGRKLQLRVCEVAQLEHAWSGGERAVPYHSGVGPSASQMMWAFFVRHRRPAT
ncbi:CE1 family esterase [Chitinimonas naiadis]